MHVSEPGQDEDVIMAHANVATAEDGAEEDKKQDVAVVLPQPTEVKKMLLGHKRSEVRTDLSWAKARWHTGTKVGMMLRKVMPENHDINREKEQKQARCRKSKLK